MKQQTFELDLIGQYYASIINRRQYGVFALSVHLKEDINPPVLQQSVNDLMCRLPFLNGRLKRGFFHYKHEVLATPPQIKPASEEPLFCDYYNKGSGHMIDIVYGKRNFTVRTTHSICDGRGLSKITSALLVRYFECLGVKPADKGSIIDCSETFQPEEAENAFERFANRNPNQAGQKSKTFKKPKAYRSKFSKYAPQHILTKVFDGSKIKAAAKTYNATVSEYILAQIFRGIEKERDADKSPIVAMIPIDCRSFFPSKTLRSFVSSTAITMPETKDFAQMLQQISAQFLNINKDNVQAEINDFQNLYKAARYVPRLAKTWFMKMIARHESAGFTTGLSNLGLMKLPAEIENRVDYFEFPISLERDTPYFFSCVTARDALALTATFRDEGHGLVEDIMNNFEI